MTFNGPFCLIQLQVIDDDGRQLMLNPTPLHPHYDLLNGRHEYGLSFADIGRRILEPHNTVAVGHLNEIRISAVDARMDDKAKHNVTLTITGRGRGHKSTSSSLLSAKCSWMSASDIQSSRFPVSPSASRLLRSVGDSMSPIAYSSADFPDPSPEMSSVDIAVRRAESGPLIGVGVIVVHHRHIGCVLIGRRRGSHGAGEYALPGGHLDYGESIESCAVREVLEETALTVDATSIKLVAVTQTTYERPHKHYVTLFVRAAGVGDDIAVNREDDKCDGWLWAKWSDVVNGKYIPLFDPLVQLAALNTDIFA